MPKVLTFLLASTAVMAIMRKQPPIEVNRPRFRRVKPLGTHKGWFIYRDLGGQLMAIHQAYHTPLGISLLDCGWAEEFRKVWPRYCICGNVVGWDVARARMELMEGCIAAGEIPDERIPLGVRIYPCTGSVYEARPSSFDVRPLGPCRLRHGPRFVRATKLKPLPAQRQESKPKQT